MTICVDALRSLPGPFRVRSGYAARIRVRIPWHALRTESVCVFIEDLTLNVERASATDGGSGDGNHQQTADTAHAVMAPDDSTRPTGVIAMKIQVAELESQ